MTDLVRIHFDLNSVKDYKLFLQVKSLPKFRFFGRTAEIPREYAERLGLAPEARKDYTYDPLHSLFDYQGDITKIALRKQKFAVFADPGLGKTLILLEVAKVVRQLLTKKKVLIISPLMVIKQTIAEARKFYGDDFPIEKVSAFQLPFWTMDDSTNTIGITNYEALTDQVKQGIIGALLIDESSYLKSHYGVWGQHCIRLGKGLEWKLSLTGTPAPNDRIEFANQAVFLDAFPTVNSFLAKFFVNKGKTGERWEMKGYAVESFYRSLSHWCIFLTNPATYGWKDNVGNIPPIHTHIHDIEMSEEQKKVTQFQTGTLFPDFAGGIASRSILSQIGKGHYKGKDIETFKPQYIKKLVDSWPAESTIIWCLYNREQEMMEKVFPDAISLKGTTNYEKRERGLYKFKDGVNRVIISKPKVMGFGLNLQIATRQVFSGLMDSYEAYFQCVKRSNRIGSTKPLNIHIPMVEVERPMIENVLRKASLIQKDTEEQERLFKEIGYAWQ